MLEFRIEGKRIGGLPGRYKGKRRRGNVPVVAECGACPWRSRPMNAKKAELALMKHREKYH